MMNCKNDNHIFCYNGITEFQYEFVFYFSWNMRLFFVVCQNALDGLHQIQLLNRQFVQWNDTVARLEAAAKPSASAD